MKILVSGTKPGLADDPRYDGLVGHLTSPRTGTAFGTFRRTGLLWAADNDAFSGFDRTKYLRMLARLRADAPPGLLFVTAPDVVGDARSTAGLFDWWLDELKPGADECGHLPVALVGQDGMEDLDWDWWLGLADALFLGGGDAWKLSRAAADLARAAKSRGLWVHMGRVNSQRRLRVAYDFGCDSVDGLSFNNFGDTKLPPACRFLRRLRRRPPAGWKPRLVQAALF